ncbi:MAG: rhodanese-like domain-containing protein [Jatrophihabitans sp.]
MTDFGPGKLPRVHRDQLPASSPILDVRDDGEWAAGHIDGAVHVPLDRLANRMLHEPGELLSDDPIVVTCKGGGRAGRAVSWLNANGFEAVLLEGSMLGWQDAGRPMVSDTGEPPVVV